jgi:hypothetical protein
VGRQEFRNRADQNTKVVSPQDTSNKSTLERAWWLVALLAIVTVILIRLRLLGIPLERDEGEYAYGGQLILEGIAPYRFAYSMKFPGTSAAYGLIMSFFGQTVAGIHFGLLLLNLATVVLIFFVGKRLLSRTAGAFAAASYAILSAGPSVLGLAGHATHFVVLPVMGGVLLLLKERNANSLGMLFLSGLLFGLGLLMKQPAVFFVLGAVIYVVASGIRDHLAAKDVLLRSLIFNGATTVPFAIACVLLWWGGAFDKFWFWTVEYARKYGGEVSLSQVAPGIVYSTISAIGAAWALWALAGLGLLFALFHSRTRGSKRFLLGFLAFCAMAVCFGHYPRSHYFIMALPAISLLSAVALDGLLNLTCHLSVPARVGPLVLFTFSLFLPLFLESRILFKLSPVEASRLLYGENPFPESLRIAEYLRDHTQPEDTIGVLGSEPQIYFYAHRRSATGYIYTYGLMEKQEYALQMQREMIRELELTKPKYLVFVETDASWLWSSDSPKLIISWANDFATQNYTLVGLINVVSGDETDYYFGKLPASPPQMDDYILIYERKL